jgi:hypothetical protein
MAESDQKHGSLCLECIPDISSPGDRCWEVILRPFWVTWKGIAKMMSYAIMHTIHKVLILRISFILLVQMNATKSDHSG